MGGNTTVSGDSGQDDFAVNLGGCGIMGFMDEANAKKHQKKDLKPPLLVVGWREWVSLPEFGIDWIKVKVDSGAKTSALHAFEITPIKKQNVHYIRFKIHPMQRRRDVVVEATARVIDIRWVTDSGGHRERRYVIMTRLVLGDQSWPIEMTLTSRDTMNFRMLLGRSAMRKRLLVNPAKSFLVSGKDPSIIR